MNEIRIPPAGDSFIARPAPPSGGPRGRTTRHHRVDRAFLALLEADFGIGLPDLAAALDTGRPAPKREAIALCEWAIRAARGDADRAGDALRAWARKHGRGAYHPAIIGGPPLTRNGRTGFEMRGV